MTSVLDSKVLMIVREFPPAVSAGVFRTIRFAKFLPEFGWEPVILCRGNLPDGPDLSHLVEPNRKLFVERVHHGDKEVSQNGSAAKTKAKTDKPASRLRLLARNFVSLVTQTPDKDKNWVKPATKAGIELIKRQQPQVIYTSGPPHSIHLVGRNLKQKTGLPWIADFRDPWARRPWGAKPSNPWGERFLQGYEGVCIRLADRVVLNTDHMAHEFRRFYTDQPVEKFVTIPNGWDPDLQTLIERENWLANRSQPRNSLKLCHAGSLYRMRDPRPLLEAISELAQRGLDICFEQIGSCHPELSVEQFAEEHQISECIDQIGHLPHRETLKRVADSDIVVVLQPGTPIQVPGKLFEALLFQKPILALCDEGALAEIVQEYEIGLVVDPNNSDDIAKAIEQLHRDYEQFSTHARWDQARQDFDGRTITGQLANQLTFCRRKIHTDRLGTLDNATLSAT